MQKKYNYNLTQLFPSEWGASPPQGYIIGTMLATFKQGLEPGLLDPYSNTPPYTYASPQWGYC